jgi:hypothetical protein
MDGSGNFAVQGYNLITFIDWVKHEAMAQPQGSSRSAGSATETRSFEPFAGSASAACEWWHFLRRDHENNLTPVSLVPEAAFRRPGYGTLDLSRRCWSLSEGVPGSGGHETEEFEGGNC